MKAGKKIIAAVDLGGTNLKVALLNAKYKIIAKETFSTREFTEKSALIEAIATAVEGIIKNNRYKKSAVSGLGLGLPGPIDSDKGIVHFFPNIPGWKEVNLKRILQKKLRLPVSLDNDANLMSLAESQVGSARGSKNAVCLTLGTGVGGGVIIGGKLYRGSSFAAGEVGHIPLNEQGPKCNCGGTACLEAYIGNHRILSEAAKIFGSKITLEELSRLAKQGNRKACLIWSGVGKKLGIALAGIIDLLDPDAIVIGGGVAEAGSVLFNSIRAAVVSRALPVPARKVKIVKAGLGSDAGLIGAAILVNNGE